MAKSEKKLRNSRLNCTRGMDKTSRRLWLRCGLHRYALAVLSSYCKVRELSAAFDKLPGEKPTPTMMLRSERLKLERAAKQVVSRGNAPQASEATGTYLRQFKHNTYQWMRLKSLGALTSRASHLQRYSASSTMNFMPC